MLLGTSASFLLLSAVGLWNEIPRLPAPIPLHLNGPADAERLGSPSELWTTWELAAGLWLVFLVLAVTLPPSGRINGLPQPGESDRPWVRRIMCNLLLTLQLIVTLVFCGQLSAALLQGSGGPDLMALILLPVAAIPVALGYFLYRSSLPPR